MNILKATLLIAAITMLNIPVYAMEEVFFAMRIAEADRMTKWEMFNAVRDAIIRERRTLGSGFSTAHSVYAMEGGLSAMHIAEIVGQITKREVFNAAGDAIRERKTYKLRNLLIEHSELLVEQDRVAELFKTAIQVRNLPAIVSMLRQGCDPDNIGKICEVARCGEWGEKKWINRLINVPLHEAARQGYIPAMKVLLDAKYDTFKMKHKANVNILDDQGNTSLVSILHSELNNKGSNANECTCEAGIALLLAHGADPSIRNDKGESILHELLKMYALKGSMGNNKTRYLTILSSLLKAGAGNVSTYIDVDILFAPGSKRTPLHRAVALGWVEGAREIIACTHGENIKLQDFRSRTALDIAYERKNAKMVHLLEHWQYECAKAQMCQFGATATGNPHLVKMLQRRELDGPKRKSIPRKQVSGKDEDEN